ncbi:MAG: CRISPR-associated endonuclease Cas1 [Chloroflexota bacterium]
MRRQAIDSLAAWPVDLAPPNGVLVLTGYGLDVRVWRGRLRVADGIGRDRREAIVHRATGRLRRLVVLGHTGSISLDAIRWLADVGAGFMQIDADGRVLAAFGPLGSDRPGLRRAQARALDTSLGLDVARRLIGEKIAAQSETLAGVAGAGVTDATVATIAEAVTRLHVAATRDDVRMAEAMAAAAYWSALAGVSVRFARRDEASAPAHWRTFGARSSPLTGSPRLAANPANSLLNVCYAILEAEATIAARIVGLDPGLGVLHADQLNRDSLSSDLMEPIRPVVDRYVFDLLERRRFAADDFFETRQGVCRVTPPLARELALATVDWGRAVGRVAEDVARRLDDGGGRPVATPFSGRNRSAGRGFHARVRRSAPVAKLAAACTWCGDPVEEGRRTCSATCLDAHQVSQAPAFIAAGRASLARLREVGFQPAASAAGRRRVATRASETLQAAREWQRTHAWPADLAAFDRDILPGLAEVTAGAIAAATGLSVGYCRKVKAGAVRPHPMWWAAMRTTSGK